MNAFADDAAHLADGAAGLGGLFVSAFTSATVLPGSSEVVLTALMATATHPVTLLVAVASVGNVLGSVLNWILGLSVNRFRGRWFFPASDAQLERAEGWYTRYGRWSLFLSALPVVGDPLTVVAGVMRERLAVFLAIVSFSKTTRYILVALGLTQVFGSP